MITINLKEMFQHLNKDPESHVELLTLVEGDLNYIIAELKPLKVLQAHYHKQGSEIYQVVSGKGILQVGVLEENKVHWTSTHIIEKDHVIEVKAGAVHQLKNTENETLQLIFITPPGHIGKDRYFV